MVVDIEGFVKVNKEANVEEEGAHRPRNDIKAFAEVACLIGDTGIVAVCPIKNALVKEQKGSRHHPCGATHRKEEASYAPQC